MTTPAPVCTATCPLCEDEGSTRYMCGAELMTEKERRRGTCEACEGRRRSNVTLDSEPGDGDPIDSGGL